MTTPSTLVAGRYRLIKLLGAGGMGVVWQAWDERLERRVALKMLRTQPELTQSERDVATARAMREARINAGLHHPHAVTVYDVVQHEGQPCLVMQLIESTPLSDLLREHGTLTPREVARIGSQVGSALAAAHQLRIVHRDVKPGNILITEDGSALISDFGISYALGDAAITATGMIHGTPAYLAPEVARGRPSSFASDVFSLGSTMYAMLEGEPPFGADKNAIALLHRVARGGYPPPKHAGALAPLLREMLSADPKRRPTMAAIAASLAQIKDTNPSFAGAVVGGSVAAPTEPSRDTAVETAVLEGQPAEVPEGSETATAATEQLTEPTRTQVQADAATEPLTDPTRTQMEADAATKPLTDHTKTQGHADATTKPLTDRMKPQVGADAAVGSAAAGAAAASSAGAGSAAAGAAAASSAVAGAVTAGGAAAAAAGASSSAAPPHPPSTPPAPTDWFLAQFSRDEPPQEAPTHEASPGRTTPMDQPTRFEAPTAETELLGAGAARAQLPPRPPRPAQPMVEQARRRRRRMGVGVALAVAVVAVIVGAVWMLQPFRQVIEAAEPTTAATSQPTTSAPSPEPTTPPAVSATPEPEPVVQTPPPPTPEERVVQTITNYYGLVPGDLASAWPLMTADYQENHAGGRGAYEAFWSAIAGVQVADLTATAPDQGQATLIYTYRDGGVTQEVTAFRLVDEGGVLKIAATDVLSTVEQ